MAENNKVSFKRQARILAFQAIYLHDLNPQSLDELLMFSWTTSIPPHVYRFAKELTGKTIENENMIVELLSKYMNNPRFEEISEVEKSILKISVCQFLKFPKILPSIVIDEAVELSKSFGGKNSFKLINAVLDAIKKELINEKKDNL